MNEVAKEALLKSIEHWKENVAAEFVSEMNTSPLNCALCEQFVRLAEGMCEGCPVMEKTGKQGCHDTPYYAAHDALVALQRGEGTIHEWRKAAQAEVDFLESLLP